MCGRYSLALDEFSELRLGVTLAMFTEPWTRRYNIAPSRAAGHEVPIIRSESGMAKVGLARFWLIPHWWTGPLAKLPTSFNARSEDLEHKPLWREPMARRRCLVPATGWREFMGPAGRKRSFQFHVPAAGVHEMASSAPFVFAGLWDRLQSNEGVIDSFAIITAAASPLVAPIHDRMPLVLPVELHERWLFADGDARAVLTEAIPRREEELQLFEVSSYGNSVYNEGPACIAPVATQTELFASKQDPGKRG